jgi:hypothetical protein
MVEECADTRVLVDGYCVLSPRSAGSGRPAARGHRGLTNEIQCLSLRRKKGHRRQSSTRSFRPRAIAERSTSVRIRAPSRARSACIGRRRPAGRCFRARPRTDGRGISTPPKTAGGAFGARSTKYRRSPSRMRSERCGPRLRRILPGNAKSGRSRRASVSNVRSTCRTALTNDTGNSRRRISSAMANSKRLRWENRRLLPRPCASWTSGTMTSSSHRWMRRCWGTPSALAAWVRVSCAIDRHCLAWTHRGGQVLFVHLRVPRASHSKTWGCVRTSDRRRRLGAAHAMVRRNTASILATRVPVSTPREFAISRRIAGSTCWWNLSTAAHHPIGCHTARRQFSGHDRIVPVKRS